MGARSARASEDELALVAGARERAVAATDRREIRAEVGVAMAFVAVALGLALVPSTDPDIVATGWLALVCAVLTRVEFEVGPGVTRPVQLVLAAMLVLLPPLYVPAVVAAGHLAGHVPSVASGRIPPRRLVMCVADSWFCVGPALVLWATGLPHSLLGGVAIIAAAFAAQVVGDFVISSVRMWAGERLGPRTLLPALSWVYLIDALLLPIAVLAAVAGLMHPAAVVAVLPLAALLAIFARERSGRLENALALQRIAQDDRDRLMSIVANSSDLVAIVRDGRIAMLTGAAASVFGPDWESAQGSLLLSHVHPDDAGHAATFLALAAERAAGETQESEWRMRFPDGSWRHVSGVTTNLSEDPRVAGLVVTIRDVHERRAFEEQLRHRAFHDPLTALANRALFYDRVEHALMRGRRRDGEVAVLYVDIDDFKPVNDRFGHAGGDRLLVEVAGRLQACLRASDTAARLGGDEFGVLIETVPGPNEPARVATRILAALTEPLTLGDQRVALSASIGIALSGARDGGVDELLRRADLAMYAAKRNGKHRLELYTPDLEPSAPSADGRPGWLHSADDQRDQVRSVLLADHALRVVFQPIMDLRTGDVAGYEALARFADAEQRPPSAWFAQAHRCGLGHELEAKALEAALAVPGRPAGTYLSVNLSPSALSSEAVMRVLPERLDGLVLEITENEAVSDDPDVASALRALRERGARLAVDDTGSGYAGLTHVMRLEPDIIKLDRSLVAGVDSDPGKAALIESFVGYARQLGATVCAEGIEEMADLARLADLDVVYGQGFGLARPAEPWAPVAEAAADTCRVSFVGTLQAPSTAGPSSAHDATLEALTERLSLARDRAELDDALHLMAHELDADEVRIGEPFAGEGGVGRVTQLLATDAAPADALAALAATGYGSRLSVPVRSGGVPLATLDAYATPARPWSRFEIRRARILSHALGAALSRIDGAASLSR